MATLKGDTGLGDERQIVDRLLGAAARAGLTADPGAVTHFYVALKSKPLMLLAGPSQSGKIALVQCLAMALTGGISWQCQFMPAHAWWAGQSGNVGLFTEAQTRLNTVKILALIEEARQPENTNRAFIVCLTRLSPAELEGFFAGTAFQLQRGELLWLPAAHLSEPVILPPNLMLIGTIDLGAGANSDPGIMADANVIHWDSSHMVAAKGDNVLAANPSLERTFLRSRIQSLKQAHIKLRHVLDPLNPMLRRIGRVEAALRQHGVTVAAAARNEMLLYLANAWDCQYMGLFDPRPEANLALALDWGLATTVLPIALAELHQSASLKLELRKLLNGDFPRAKAYLDQLR